MRLDTWDELDDLTYDRALLSDLTSLRFIEAGNGVLILGPVGVGKTRLASALGHIAIRRRLSVRPRRPRGQAVHLPARRPPRQHPGGRDAQARPRRPAHPRRLRLGPLDAATQTNDFYELVVDRHRRTSTIVTFNRKPSEWADHDQRRAARLVLA